jgi:hypothetical protein
LAALLLVMVLGAAPNSSDRHPTAAKPSGAVRRWMKGMTLRDEVAQLVFIEFPGRRPTPARAITCGFCA